MLRLITPKEKLNCPKLWKSFTVADTVKAKLEITGLGLYRAFLNGHRIGEDYLTPGFNDYDAYLTVSSYDVSSLLQFGDNTLEVYLGDGWYMGRFGLQNTTNIWGSDYLLGVRLTMDGQVALETDETWQASASVIRSSSIYDGEVRDDTADSAEACYCVPADKTYQQELEQYPPIRVYQERKPSLIVTPKGETVLDFEQNLAGVVRFVNHAPKGATITLKAGETLQQGCFYRDNLRSAKAEYVYISDGRVKEIEPFFTFYGFRYMLVEGLETVDPEDFTALCLSSEMRDTLRCTTANPLINRLIENSWWGQRSNFVGVPTDCPQRDERLGWTGDAQVFCVTAMYQTDCQDFYRQFARSLREDQLRYLNGNLPLYSPSLKGQARDGGAVWADAGVIIPVEAYRFFGDKNALQDAWPMIHDYIEVMIAADGRLGNTHVRFDSFTCGDWLALDGESATSVRGGTSERYIQGMYYLKSVRMAAEAAHVLGNTQDAARYDSLAKNIHSALLDEYVTPNGHLSVDTQTGYALALTLGLYRDKPVMAADLHDRLHRDCFKLKTGFTGTPILLPALLDSELVSDAYRILLNEGYPGWLHCVKLGATTIWERWNSIEPDGSISDTGMNSLNHYAYGSVCETIYSRIAGLRCSEPGWKKAIIAPCIDARLRHIALEFLSPMGKYASEWEVMRDGSCQLTVTVPDGAEAEIIIPDHPDALRERLNGCTKTYAWKPTRDMLNIYNLETSVGELLRHPDGRRLINDAFPELIKISEQANKAGEDIMAHSLFDLVQRPPYLSYLKVLPMAEELKKLSVAALWEND